MRNLSKKQVLALHSDLIREFGHGGDSGRRAVGIGLGRPVPDL